MIKRIQNLFGRYAMASLSLLSTYSFNKRLAYLLITLLLGTGNLLAQGVSLTFSSGYLGTQASATQQTSNIKNLSTLGIARVSFSQSYPGTFGGTQGNDLSGVIRLYMNSGQVISLNGALNWRETTGNNIDVFGLIFDPGQNATITYGTNQTYNIIGGSTNNTSTSLGLKAYASSVTFTDGAARNGNAATSSIIGDMNTELASSPQPSSISVTNSTIIESQNLVYTVTLSSATLSGRPQVYTFSTSGSATKGADYSSIYTFSNGVVNNGDGTITVPAGVSSFTVTISTIDDSLVESIENVLITVGSKTGLGSIADNDAPTAPNCDVNNPYDKIVSGYHQSIALKTDASFAVWGEDLDNTGAGEVLTPRDINVTNFPNLVGIPLKAAVGGQGGGGKEQAILLTTDGLYVWGNVGYVINYELKGTAAFGKIATNLFTANNVNTATGLPLGVNPYDVKMMTATYGTLVLLTNAGDVWTLSQNVGTSATGNTGVYPKTWFKAQIDANTYLTGVTAVRAQTSTGSLNAIMALKSDGTVYTWGSSTYLGDGSASAQRTYATKMTLPAEFSITNIPKMIAVTGGIKNSTSVKNSYYILSNSGALYSLGYNAQKQLGDFTTTERTSWVNAKINATTNFSDVSFITAQEHDASFPGIAAVTKTGALYTWGENEGLALGRTTDGADYDPGIPMGFTLGTDIALSAELGGHTLVYLKQGTTQFCYVGHKIAGSMGDGVSTGSFINTFNCANTPSMNICGSVPVSASTSTSTISANPTSIAANGTSTSVITVQLKQANGTNLTSTGGTVIITTNKGTISSVTDNNDGTYSAILTSSTFVETATLNYTLNGSAGTNSASVNFTAVTNPVLTATGNLKTFTSCSGCTVAPQSFTISGIDLATNNIVVTAPTGVQVSTSINSGYATSINITPTAGTVTTTTVYVKLTNSASSVASSVISVTSTGAVAKTITVTTNTDNALNFDGTNDYVNLPSTFASAYNHPAVTIEAWIKTSDAKAINEIIGWGSSTLNNNVVEFRTSSGKLQFILNDGTKFYGLESTSLVNTGKWVHVAVVKSGSSAVLYVNGQVASGAPVANSDITSTPTLDRSNIGLLAYKTSSVAYGPIANSYFNGGIDQLRIWNTARTSSDIAANMFVEMAGNETGLVASYDFNQGVASGTNVITTLNDRSNNSYNGTLTNFLATMSGTTSNFVAGFVPEITAAGNATTLATGNTLQLSNGLTGGVWTSSNASLASVNSASGLVTGVASGTVSISYTICDKTVSYTLTLITPTITTTGTLKQFTSCSGCGISPQSFAVSGTNLGANVIISAPTGFEISNASGGTYSSTLTLSPSSGTVSTTTIYARLINSASSAVGGNITITSTGATTRTVTATVNTDNGLMLDGVGDYVNLGDVLDYSTVANTTEAWVYWKGSTEAFSEIFTKDVIQSFSITSGNKLHANFGDGSTWNSGLNSTTSVPLNTWTHLAVTRSSTGVVKMYINGVLDASTNTMNVTGNNTALRSIGAKNVGGVIYGPFTGAIDNIKVWNVEKSITDITNGMFTELAGNESDLLAYYDFNQGIARGTNTSITSLLDKGPSAFSGTITGIALTGSTSNFVEGSIPAITAAGNSSTVLTGGTLALSNGLVGGVWSSSNSNVASINTSTGVVTGVAAGNATLSYSICGKGVTYNVTVLVPTITTGTLKTFTSCSGCVITPQSFAVSGINLGANVIISAPTGFEISNTSGGTYSSTLTLSPSSGTLTSTNVFARLINSATTATGGNFTVASTGAVSKTVTATVNKDNALSFDGVDDIISTASNISSLNITGDITVETWIRLNQMPNDYVRLIGKGSQYERTYGLWLYSDGSLLWQQYTPGIKNLITNGSIIPVGKWTHIAVSKTGSNVKIYVNGNEVASSSSFSGTPNSSTAPLEIGGSSSIHALLNGSMDEVRIWNVGRTSNQIASYYLSELAGDGNSNETGLVAYYNFNQGTANGTNSTISQIQDRTSNGFSGTLTNFAKTGSTSNFVAGFIPEISGDVILNKGLTTTYTNSLTGGTWSSSNTNIATVNSFTGVVTGVNPGTSTITYTICEKTVSKVVTVVVPTITKTGTLTPFSTCLGTASNSQTFTVSAQYLTANLVLTAPTGYEIATSLGGTYSSTITIAPTSGTVSTRLIYVRLSTASVNGQSGNIAITSTDAATQNVSTGIATVTRPVVASVTISSNATNNSICVGTNVVFTATPTNGGNAPTYQWKLNGNNITGATSATYSSTSLATNDAISVVMTSSLSTCVSGTPASSNTITTTVSSAPSTPGVISGLTTICLNSNQVYSVPAVTGATSYTWVVSGNLTATLSTTNVINITAANTQGSGMIQVFANNACGTSVASSSVSITINNTPAPTASFTLSSNTVCLTNAGITFTNASTPNATTNSPIGTYAWVFGDGATATTASASNTYTSSGSFDAILTITDGNQCTSSISSRITVDPISVAGTASVTNPTICEGSSTGLTLTGYTGAIQWQKSTDGINFTNITGANTAIYNTGNLTTTTYYQAVVTSGACSSATSGVITVTVSPTPAVTLASVANINSTATSFDLTYSNAVGTPDEYSITAVGPNAMPNFVAISNYGLPVSPVTVSIPASTPGTYNFNLLVKNGTLGCVSPAIPFNLTITAASSTITVTGLTTYTYNGSGQGPVTNIKTGSTGAVTYSYSGTGSTTYGPSSTLPTGVGTYEVIATLAADASYSGATSAPYAFTISAASSTITVTGLTTYTYNGAGQGPVTNTKTGSAGAVTYSYSGTGSTTYGPSATLPTGVGSYQVIATLASDVNYSGATSAPYAFIINDAPSVISINRVENTPTNLSTLHFVVTFSKGITGFDLGDLTLINTGTVSTTSMVVSTITSSTYTVTVSGITGNGTLGLDLKSSGTGIVDNYGAGITNGITGQVYTIDKITLTPSFNTPATNDNFVGTSLGISVNIPEINLANTIRLTFAGLSNTVLVTLNNGSGIFSGNLNLNNLVASSIVASSSLSTLPSDIYTVTVSYQDYLGNPVASAFINNFKVNYSLTSTISVTGATTYTYNANPQGPATHTKTGSTGAVTYSYAGTGSTTYGPSATLPTGVGTYQVIATLAADANYSGATSAPYAFTITSSAPVDSDGDGVTDTQEIADGTDPNDGCSYLLASKTLTPSAAWNAFDCDGDGTPNGTDTDPKDPCVHAAGATPVYTNAIWRAADCDGDGVANGKEKDDNTDPNDGCSYVLASRTLTPSAAWGALDCDKDGNSNATDPHIVTPEASNDVVTVGNSGKATVNILTNDDFLPGANTEITRQASPNEGTAKGTVTFNPLTGEMTYKRAPFESGLVTMGYKVTNKGVNPPVSATAFVTIVACDLQDPLADCDGDGDPNGTDNAPTDPCVYSTTLQVKANVSDDWKALDCDGDGVINGTELTDGTLPADGCSFKAPSITLAPSAAWLLLDCDADGITNKVEGTQDFDGDGIPNCLDTDSDGDSISDKLETTVDTDKDGKPDYLDLDSDNDGILDSVENRVCTGTGILCDTDADGKPNFRDLDSDADQISDVIEANGSDYNRDGIADGNIDEKGIPTSANKGLTPPDTDRDGKLDPYDVDSDGDGILDYDEEYNEDADFPDCDHDGIINRLDPDECDIFSPQGISPNGDGKNDRLVFKGLYLRKIPNHLSIYNRWGTLVFEMESYDNTFTGTSLPDGTYYYILDFFGKKPTISNYLSVDRTIK